MWEYLLKFIVMQLLAEALKPKVKIDRPPAAGLKDIGLPTADETRPLPWLIGRAKVDAPNLIATYDFKSNGRSKKQRTGLMSSTTIPLGYDYYVAATEMLCAGGGVRLREIWAGSGDDAVMIWSGNIGNGGSAFVNYKKIEKDREDYPQGFRGYVYFKSGSTTPDAYLTAKAGAGNVPAWPHATYVTLRGSATTTDGGMWVGTTGQILPLSFVVERAPTEASVGLGPIPSDIVVADANGDANPALAVAELLTDPIFGAGEHPSFIDAESIWAAARVFQSENHFIGTLIDQQRTVGDVVFEFCRQTGSLLQPNPSTGNRTLKPLRAGDTPVLVLDDSNIESLASFARSSFDEATTSVTVNYLDRAARWKQRPVTVHNTAVRRSAGSGSPNTQQYSSVTSAELAQKLAMRDLRALSAPLATARLTAIVPKRQRLLPGDLVVFSSAKNGISNVHMRVTSSRFSQPGDRRCEIELIEDVFTTGMSVFAQPVAATPPGPIATPGPIGSILFNWPNGIIAPRQLSGAAPGKYHMMFFAGADAANAANSYELGYSDAAVPVESTVAWDQKGFIGFAAKGRVLSNVGGPGNPIAVGNAIPVDFSAADAQTVRNNAGGEVLVMRDWHVASAADREWFRGTIVMTTTTGTAGTLTITAVNPYGSGLWGPAGVQTGDDMWLLYDYAIDTGALPVQVFGTDSGNPATNAHETTAASNARARTVGGSFSYNLTSPSSGATVTGTYGIASGTRLPRWDLY